jgi:hypothetical protein
MIDTKTLQSKQPQDPHRYQARIYWVHPLPLVEKKQTRRPIRLQPEQGAAMRPLHMTQGQPLPVKIGHYKSNLNVQIQRNIRRRMRQKVQERQIKHAGKGCFIGSSPWRRAAAAGAQGRRAGAGM